MDGKALAAQIRASLGARIARAAAAGQAPGLAVVLVGDDPASAVYVRNKIQACHDCGIRSFADRLPADTTESTLLARINRTYGLVARVDAVGTPQGNFGFIID